jgi:carboxypeptidase C (cathepsin A)
MLGLIQEHGPCRINNDTDSVALNSFSWNENSNMLYIDQPVGVGFSTGNRVIRTSDDAAKDIWTFMQIWLSDSRFSQYKSRDLAIWAESYVILAI